MQLHQSSIPRPTTVSRTLTPLASGASSIPKSSTCPTHHNLKCHPRILLGLIRNNLLLISFMFSIGEFRQRLVFYCKAKYVH